MQHKSKTVFCLKHVHVHVKQNTEMIPKRFGIVVSGSLAYLFARRQICKSQNSFSLWLVAKVYQQSDRWYETVVLIGNLWNNEHCRRYWLLCIGL